LYFGDPDYDWMVTHEWHLLGLRDRYRGRIVNGQTVSIPDPGWEDNIMAARNKPVQQRNIDEFCQLAKKMEGLACHREVGAHSAEDGQPEQPL
jgi:hypothetical protein